MKLMVPNLAKEFVKIAQYFCLQYIYVLNENELQLKLALAVLVVNTWFEKKHKYVTLSLNEIEEIVTLGKYFALFTKPSSFFNKVIFVVAYDFSVEKQYFWNFYLPEI